MKRQMSILWGLISMRTLNGLSHWYPGSGVVLDCIDSWSLHLIYLDMDILQEIVCRFGKPDIDLFASRLNHKLEKYISFRPDPNAMAVDAFSISRTKQYVYIFAPFRPSVWFYGTCGRRGRSISSSPLWTTQSWWPQLAHLIVNFPIKLLPTRKILYQPNNLEGTHPLQKLKLEAFRVSGKFCKAEEFMDSLPP